MSQRVQAIGLGLVNRQAAQAAQAAGRRDQRRQHRQHRQRRQAGAQGAPAGRARRLRLAEPVLYPSPHRHLFPRLAAAQRRRGAAVAPETLEIKRFINVR
jgi:hypothetical protein